MILIHAEHNKNLHSEYIKNKITFGSLSQHFLIKSDTISGQDDGISGRCEIAYLLNTMIKLKTLPGSHSQLCTILPQNPSLHMVACVLTFPKEVCQKSIHHRQDLALEYLRKAKYFQLTNITNQRSIYKIPRPLVLTTED